MRSPSSRIARVAALAFASTLWAAAPARAEAAATVSVTVDEAPESTRIVLTHSAEVAHVVQSSRRRITILYAEPVAVEPGELRADGNVLERLRQRDPRELQIDTGPEYDRFESFELHNPYRLVLDLYARPERKGRAERGRAAALEPGTILVVDPGHGGVEQGAVGPGGAREKDLTLALARRLRIALQQADPKVTVVLTRDEDRLVGLDERTAIANHNRADLFLSIHLNASPRTGARGAETYYLATDATDDEARLLAAQENASNEGATGTASGGGPAPLDLVLWDLAQNRHLAQSSALAESVQRHLNQLTGTRDRGVRQAPFRVLMGATMPAILVEVGFISNPEEEQRLGTSTYMNQVVDAIVAAVREFLSDLKNADRPAPAADPDPDRP